MKKISTVAVKQIRNFSKQKLTIGLELGDRSSWYCVLDATGSVLLEQRLSTTPKAMKEVFGAMPRSRIALETGMHSPWVSRLLSELGHEVIVAHARQVRLIGESRKKDDRRDAQTLARLARIDPKLLCPVKHRSAKAQADLTVIRARAGLVRARTALVNTARGLAKSYGERLRGCNVRNMNPEKAQGLSPELRTALEPLLAGIESLSERIRECNEGIERRAQELSATAFVALFAAAVLYFIAKHERERERRFCRLFMVLSALVLESTSRYLPSGMSLSRAA
jgi:transposase